MVEVAGRDLQRTGGLSTGNAGVDENDGETLLVSLGSLTSAFGS